MSGEQVDAVVVGAGVVGLAVARALALAGREVLVLEAAESFGTATSARNSEVIHAGIYYPQGSLKARLCVEGKELLYGYCAERGIAHRRCGKLIVATSAAQVDELRAIRQRAAANGVGDLRLLTQAGALARPLKFAFSWDEEIGCRGIAEMIDQVIPTLGRPDLCIVGEPTSLRLVTGHKGKASYRAIATGEAGHSAMAPQFRNALHPAADLVRAIRDRQAALMTQGARDARYDPPVSTIHAGVFRGGTALNIVPDRAELLFEIRHLAAETPEDILAGLDVPQDVTITQTGSYPGLDGDAAVPAIRAFASGLTQAEPGTVAFGTEAGFFAALGLPTIVWGPGDMRDGHQPDESIAIADLDGCIRILRTFLSR